MARVEKAKMEHDGEDNASAAEAAEAATFRLMIMALGRGTFDMDNQKIWTVSYAILL